MSRFYYQRRTYRTWQSQFGTNTTRKWTAFTITGNSHDLSAVNACAVPTLAIWRTITTTCYNAVVKMKQDHKFQPTKILTHTHTIVSKLYDYYTDSKVNNQRMTNYVANILIWQYPNARHVIDFADYTVIKFKKTPYPAATLTVPSKSRVVGTLR